MPSRIVSGHINSSESLARVSVGAELTFRALIHAVDDYGRFDGRLAVLKAALFPLRDEVTLKKLEAYLTELAAGDDPPIQLYQVDGRPYVAMTKWEKHRGTGRRGRTSKWPEPLPLISEESSEMHELPPVYRESGDGNRETSDGNRELPRRPRKSLCPTAIPEDRFPQVMEWAKAKGFTPDQIVYAWERVHNWSHAKRVQRDDWPLTLYNAMQDGWALRGFTGPGALVPTRESAAQSRERRTKEAAAEAFARMTTDPELPLLGPEGMNR